MNVTIFKDLTPEEKLTSVEKQAAEYIGLYVDMDDLKQRKYVKDKEAEIGSIRKALNASRIKKVKDYTLEVKFEFEAIDARLDKANEPFTLLIDEWNAKRKEILEAEKAIKQAAELAIQKEIDHDTALMMDKVYLIEKREREEARAAHEQSIREQAQKDADERHKREMEEAKQRELSEKQAREASKEHVRGINRAILESLKNNGVGEFEAKTLITLIERQN